MENFEKYLTIQKKWEEVYAEQLKLVDRGLIKSMWKAPGL